MSPGRGCWELLGARMLSPNSALQRSDPSQAYHQLCLCPALKIGPWAHCLLHSGKKKSQDHPEPSPIHSACPQPSKHSSRTLGLWFRPKIPLGAWASVFLSHVAMPPQVLCICTQVSHTHKQRPNGPHPTRSHNSAKGHSQGLSLTAH